jgi:hypothetical protein
LRFENKRGPAFDSKQRFDPLLYALCSKKVIYENQKSKRKTKTGAKPATATQTQNGRRRLLVLKEAA